MNKKSLFFWFAAFVCAALIFTGCPQEADDSTPETKPTVVSDGAIAGVTVPVWTAAPVSEVTATDEYTGTVMWADSAGAALEGNFAASTVYTATITLSAKEGYTFTGFEGGFTVAGVDTGKDDADFTDGLKQEAGTGENVGKWVVTAVFPATANDPLADANALVGVDGALYNKATADGATLTLTGDVSIGTGTLAIPTGVTLVVPDGRTVTVSNGATLDVDGIVSVAGTFTVAGAIEVAGTLTLADGADGDLKGTITVKSSGVSKDLKSGGGALWNDAGSTGKYVFEAGAKAYVGGEDDDNDLLIGASTDTTALIQLESGTFSNSLTNYTLDGVAEGKIQPDQSPQNILFIFGNMTFTIKAGSELKITGVSNDHRSILGIMVTDDNKPVVTGELATASKAAARIVLGQYGFIDFYNSSGEYSSDASSIEHNFYNNSGAKETTSGLNSKTYTWTADADNTEDTTPGWKAGS